jgi:hypothetical protein
LTVALAERERQLSIARDEENMWLITGHQGQGQSRGYYQGALDVDMVFSPFFNALPLRRTGLHRRADSVALPVLYVSLPDLGVTATTISYSSSAPEAGAAVLVNSPAGETTVTVDDDGFIIDYPGLAERI